MTIKTLDSHQAFAHLHKILGTSLVSDTDIVITHSNQPVVVVVPYQDYLAMQEELKKLRLARQKQTV